MNDPNKMIGKNAYWFDENFEINPEKDNILKMKNMNIKLNLKFESKFERDLWYMEINKRIEKKMMKFYIIVIIHSLHKNQIIKLNGLLMEKVIMDIYLNN